MPDARIDPLRLMRGVWLTVDVTGLGDTAWVSGGERRHFVDWRRETCDCEDRAGHPELYCKHLLAPEGSISAVEGAVLAPHYW